MKGFVPTPRATVDQMVSSLFMGRRPKETDTVLDPGCGTGQFIDGVLRWCVERGLALPNIVGVESDPRHLAELTARFREFPNVRIENRDYLDGRREQFEFVIANPPYVPITQLSEAEKHRYRSLFKAAQGRFDLYILFFEQALINLAPGGRLVFITPEKFLYVHTAGALRDLLAQERVESIELADEATFGSLVTYPTITTLSKGGPGDTLFRSREGVETRVRLPRGQGSWMPILKSSKDYTGQATLADVCSKISCGIATGADSVFVLPDRELSPELAPFSYPTISGRELRSGQPEAVSTRRMLIPYDSCGRLLAESQLGKLGDYMRRPAVRDRLLARTCVARKPWYAFHETPILPELLRPKILCKDICEQPVFVPDVSGEIVPRHSVYYIVPHDPELLPELLDYLNSAEASRWLNENSQRAAKGYLRIQSRVLQRLPIPDALHRGHSGEHEVSHPSYHSKQLALSF